MPQRAQIVDPTAENLARIAEAIQNGDIAGMPTETVYGLAGDCRSPLAITRIFETKERPSFDPLIVHVGLGHRGLFELSRAELIDLAQIPNPVRDVANRLTRAFWPGPLTLILPKHSSIPDLVTSGLSTVALRMPSHPVAQALISASQRALAAPSANRFGRISPTSAQAVAEELGDRIDWILEGGECSVGVESTVISFENTGEIRMLRPGGISKEELEKAASVKVLDRQGSFYPAAEIAGTPKPEAPGLLASHYAPGKPLFLLPTQISEISDEKLRACLKAPLENLQSRSRGIGILLLSGQPRPIAERISGLVPCPVSVASLSPSGSIQEAAHHLFSELRKLDRDPTVGVILSEPCLSNSGLGYAIQDRLSRASAK